MPAITPDDLNRLDALNAWLADMFGEGTRFSTLLQQAGMSEVDIAAIKAHHLAPFIAEVVDWIASPHEGVDAVRRNQIMLRRYGLVSGKGETLQVIADSFGVSRERIRQILEKRRLYFRAQRRREAFIQAIVTIAKQMVEESRAE